MHSASHQGQDPSFGSAVSLVGDQVLVGAPQANDSGAAFLFDIDGGSLTERAQLQVADLAQTQPSVRRWPSIVRSPMSVRQVPRMARGRFLGLI